MTQVAVLTSFAPTHFTLSHIGELAHLGVEWAKNIMADDIEVDIAAKHGVDLFENWERDDPQLHEAIKRFGIAGVSIVTIPEGKAWRLIEIDGREAVIELAHIHM